MELAGRPTAVLGPMATARLTMALQASTHQVEAVRLFMVEVCRLLDWIGGIYYIVDPAAPRHLTPICQTHVEGRLRASALLALATRAPSPDMQGIGGRVVDTGRPAWVADVVASPHVQVPPIAEAAGVRGGIAVPVYQGDRLAAVVEFFSDQPIQPGPALLQELAYLGRVAGQRILDLPPGTLALDRDGSP